MISQKITQGILEALKNLDIEAESVVVEHPGDLTHGDYATSAALQYAKLAGKNPKDLALSLKAELEKQQIEFAESIEIAGPGFLNFKLSKEFFKQGLQNIIKEGSEFGKNNSLKGEKVIVEHTDPNPFKPLHIGHLLPLSVGAAIAKIYEWNGAEVKQACYQGDVGLHVAKAIWGFLQGERENAYPVGNRAYEENETSKKEIIEINKKVYDRSDEKINDIYDKGREASLLYFNSVYKKLGVTFDYFFFESEVAEKGKEVVLAHPGIFIESQGAIIFPGETHDASLHTRVFINSEGLPVYEAKELALAKLKADKYPYTQSIVVTGNEIKEYFQVLLAAMRLVFPDLAAKTKHITHGMLRLPSGKMSSRTGDVITAENLIEEVKEKVKGDEAVAVGAIKYMILRSGIGGDVIFDMEKSVSTEGDSGVYLQYAYARTRSLLEKAGKKGSVEGPREHTHDIEKLLYRFPEVVRHAMEEYAPHLIVTYLIELSGSFNNFYAKEQVISDDPESPYRLAITEAFNIVLKNGLTILGIPTPERM